MLMEERELVERFEKAWVKSAPKNTIDHVPFHARSSALASLDQKLANVRELCQAEGIEERAASALLKRAAWECWRTGYILAIGKPDKPDTLAFAEGVMSAVGILRMLTQE